MGGRNPSTVLHFGSRSYQGWFDLCHTGARIDWYPTLLELAGVDVPKQQAVDGVSLMPLLRGQTIPDRPLFWHYPHYGNQGGEPSSIILKGGWKLIYYHEDGRNELYDLSQDEVEQKDLAGSEKDRVTSMRAELDQWLKVTNAKFPSKDPQFDAAKRAARWAQLKTAGNSVSKTARLISRRKLQAECGLVGQRRSRLVAVRSQLLSHSTWE